MSKFPKQRPPKTPRGHGNAVFKVNTGQNNRATRRRFLATFGGRKRSAGEYGRHYTEQVRVPIKRHNGRTVPFDAPDGKEAQIELAYHARKGWRQFLVFAGWTEQQRANIAKALGTDTATEAAATL